jgi:hypothetical protein
VSEDTIKSHRKNVYAAIGTQSELFSCSSRTGQCGVLGKELHGQLRCASRPATPPQRKTNNERAFRPATPDPDYQAADAAHHIHAFLDQKALNAEGPRVIVGGERLHLWDNDGKRYLDGMSGLWCTQLGYGRRDLTAAAAQMDQLAYYNMFFHTTHPAVIELSELLFSLLPGTTATRSTPTPAPRPTRC